MTLEEGAQSAWLYEVLERRVDDIIVTGVTSSRGPKSNRRDAYALAERLCIGAADKSVYKVPKEFAALRELARV